MTGSGWDKADRRRAETSVKPVACAHVLDGPPQRAETRRGGSFRDVRRASRGSAPLAVLGLQPGQSRHAGSVRAMAFRTRAQCLWHLGRRVGCVRPRYRDPARIVLPSHRWTLAQAHPRSPRARLRGPATA